LIYPAFSRCKREAGRRASNRAAAAEYRKRQRSNLLSNRRVVHEQRGKKTLGMNPINAPIQAPRIAYRILATGITSDNGIEAKIASIIVMKNPSLKYKKQMPAVQTVSKVVIKTSRTNLLDCIMNLPVFSEDYRAS
jgi:hypothetical protein